MNTNNLLLILNRSTTNINLILEMLSEYLDDKKFKNSDKFLTMIRNNPALLEMIISSLLEYFIRKYCINSIVYKGQVYYYV